MRRSKITMCFYGVVMAFILFFTVGNLASAEEQYSGGAVKVIYDYIGHYALNYTGNTNHYDYWSANGTNKLVSNNYKDRADIPSSNNSSASINPTDDKSEIKYAFLLWQSRSEKAPTKAVGFITPNGTMKTVSADRDKICQDTRINARDESYVGVYTMVADVTSIVCSEAGGYGTYTVANIPVWDGVQSGEVVCGGESVASWQLVVVEESPNFPLRTISLNALSQYFFNINYTVNVNFADASAPNGDVSLQWYDLLVDADSQLRRSGSISTDPAHWHDPSNYKYTTQSRGLYKNGEAFNTRDTGSLYGTGSGAKGAIYGHLYDDVRSWNDVSTSGKIYLQEGTNRGICVTTLGIAIDVFAYDIVFDGNGATSGSMDNLICIYGRGYELPENKYQKTHWKFVGWNTKADGSGEDFSNGKYIRNLTATEDKVILYAQYIPDAYKITLDNENAFLSGTRQYYQWYGYGNYSDDRCTSEIKNIMIPQKKGFIFRGYYTQRNGQGSRYVDEQGVILSTATTFDCDTTLYAYWDDRAYKVTLDNQGATTAGTTEFYGKYGVGYYTAQDCSTDITKIDNPSKAHYEFSGYYTEKNGNGQQIIDEEGNILQSFELFNKDITLYAKWSPMTYIISLDSQNATIKGTNVYYERYGYKNYTIYGIKGETSRIEKRFEYTGNTQVFIAPYTGIYDLAVWGAGGDRSVAENTQNRSLITGTIALRKGESLYVYVGGQANKWIEGWNGGGDSYDDLISYRDGMVYVTAGSGATDIRRGGMELKDRIIVASGSGGIMKQYLSAGNSKNMTVMANPNEWGLESYFTIYYNNPYNASKFSSNVESFTLLSANQTTSKKYWIFPDGLDKVLNKKDSKWWKVDAWPWGNPGLGKSGIGGGGGLYGGMSMTAEIYPDGSANSWSILGTPSRGSCYIDGVINGTIWNNVNGVYAIEENSTVIPYCSAEGNVYNVNSGNGLATITYDNYIEMEELTTINIVIPQKKGYKFGGYYTKEDGQGTKYVDVDGTILSTPTTFIQDTTLYAHWIEDATDTYKIQFYGNGADTGTMPLMICNFNQTYHLIANAFTRTGYTFAGWSTSADGTIDYADNANVNNLGTFSGEVITLYAQWTAGDASYKVDHYIESLTGGWVLHSTTDKTGISGSELILSDLKKSIGGFTYQYASVKGNVVEKAVVSADGSLVINMYYTRNSYKVTLEKDDGISFVSGEGIYKHGEAVNIDAEVLSNYEWDNWSGDFSSADKCYAFIMPMSYVTMKANTKIPIYTIHLDSQKANEHGTIKYYEKYSVGNYSDSGCTTSITKITIPKRSGYEFGGYYTDIGGDGTQYIDTRGSILATATTFTEDTVLYAKWIPITYAIHFNGNGATGGAMNDMACTYDMSYQLSENQYIRDKYRFVGWNTKADGTGQSFINKAYIENLCITQDSMITLFAQWTPNSYIVHFDANSGVGTMDDMECEFYVDYELTANQFTKVGYDFGGWSLTPDGEIGITDKAVINNLHSTTGIVTLYAKWLPSIVSYRVNQYTESLENGWELYGTDELMGYTETVLVLDDLVKSVTGFTYKHAMVNGVIVNEAAILAEGTLIIDLYYTRNSYIVTLDKDEGILQVSGAGIYKYGEKVTIDAEVYAGYLWNYWSGTYAITDKMYEFTMPAEDVSMKANTRLATYIIRFDGNGADCGSMSDMCCVFGQEYKLLPNEFIKGTEFGLSTFLGWSTDLSDTAAVYKDEAFVIDLTDISNDVVTLYAIWDDCPWIIAQDLYYSLYEAQNGLITYEELMSKAVAEDREDGTPLIPGIDTVKGTTFTIVDYLPTDFTQFTAGGSITETYQVIDSAGNSVNKMITVHVVDTTPIEILPDGTTRFINEKYYNETYENGGLEDDSVWKTDPEFVAIIQEAFDNLRNDTPISSFLFTFEEIMEMKEFIRINGIGNSQNKEALQQFYDKFMVPNIVNLEED